MLVFCNFCFEIEDFSENKQFYIASCGHVSCKNCVQYFCPICDSPCEAIAIGKDMPSEYAILFEDPIKLMKKVEDVVQFQNTQQGIALGNGILSEFRERKSSCSRKLDFVKNAQTRERKELKKRENESDGIKECRRNSLTYEDFTYPLKSDGATSLEPRRRKHTIPDDDCVLNAHERRNYSSGNPSDNHAHNFLRRESSKNQYEYDPKSKSVPASEAQSQNKATWTPTEFKKLIKGLNSSMWASPRTKTVITRVPISEMSTPTYADKVENWFKNCPENFPGIPESDLTKRIAEKIFGPKRSKNFDKN